MSRQFALKVCDGHLLYTKKHVTLDRGETLVEQGRAERFEDRDGTIWFLLPGGVSAMDVVRAAVRRDQHSTEPRGEIGRSCSVLSRAEVEAAIDPGRKSRTEGLSDEQRAARIRKGWQAEDLVERSREKLRCFQPGVLEARV